MASNPPMPSLADITHAHCWDCGYSLIGLDTPRCPECGRPFDPADPKSMNLGKPMGRLARWIAGGIGWPVLLGAVAATALTAFATRPPVEGWRFSLVDLAIT